MRHAAAFLMFFSMTFMGCAKEDPGKINITLDFDGTANAIKSSIKRFVFVIGEQGAQGKLIYPSVCLGCSDNSSPCPVSKQCLESSCGFSTSDSESVFDPEINFSDISEGKTLQIISCGLDNASAPIVSGSGLVKNRADSEATITISASATVCTNNLPAAVCP